MSWWDTLWKTRAEDWTFVWLTPASSGAAAAAEADRHYVNVFLKSARVVDVRRGLRTFYGTVHSYIRVPHRSDGMAEFNVVTTPAALKDVDSSGLERVIQFNQRLLGPVPYVGGDLEVEVGLFSVASSDLTAPYLALLENLSKTAGVAYVTAALPFAGPILEGMKLLTGSSRDVSLEIGFSTAQPTVRLGHCAAIRAPRRDIDARSLSLDPSDFRLLANGAPLTEYPYLVVEFSAQEQRTDWAQIPEIKDAYRRVQDEFRAGREAGVKDALSFFRRVALTCNDLLEHDARQLVDKVTGRYDALGAPAAGVRGPSSPRAQVPALEEIGLYD